ncbi:uncharacterized protein LOC115043879 [Echeneis naucrates]|uniref:uncharacterized protein LOC115043879 n=1 Tax=Echeneis naucrates TaxID=173247 RepID=UPI001113536C|nr:uncharacterized protein LOC115043879 [Echeneis naucrates]
MQGFLLLVLTLGIQYAGNWAGHEETEVCKNGWVQFTFNKGDKNSKRCQFEPSQKKWKSRISIHNTDQNTLLITGLQQEDPQEYSLNCGGETLKLKFDDCRRPFHQTAYVGFKTIITCDIPKKVNFFCRKKGVCNKTHACKPHTDPFCEDISSTKPKQRVSLIDNNGSIHVSISKTNKGDAGVYWCGRKSATPTVLTGLRQIELEVKEITKVKRTTKVGQTFEYWCQSNLSPGRFFCKGEDPTICERVATLKAGQHNVSQGRFSMKEGISGNVTITVRNVTADDSGAYWCGAESPDSEHSDQFFNRLIMNVETAPPTAPPPTAPHGFIDSPIAVIVSVAVLLLAVITLIFIYKYKSLLQSKQRGNGEAAQSDREDYTYEEIQSYPPKPDTGNAGHAVYTSVRSPTPCANSLHYSSITFPKRCGEAGGGVQTPEPRSTACEYSCINTTRSPARCTDTHPPTSTQEPLYATLSKC